MTEQKTTPAEAVQDAVQAATQTGTTQTGATQTRATTGRAALRVNPALLRNGMRYLAGALVARGLIGAETGAALASDPLVMQAVSVAAGMLLAGATEIAYALAKRLGWRT